MSEKGKEGALQVLTLAVLNSDHQFLRTVALSHSAHIMQCNEERSLE